LFEPNKIIVILGPTASGKTKLAVNLAYKLNTEIISADSRQVYKKLNLGTGKDYKDYLINDTLIKCNLIDIIEPTETFNLANYINTFNSLIKKYDINKIPILCGGTGLYIQSLLQQYKYANIPVNKSLRIKLENLGLTDLQLYYNKLPETAYSNIADISNKKKCIRAIEIMEYLGEKKFTYHTTPLKYIVFGLKPNLSLRRDNITLRLNHRLDNGLIEEVKQLLAYGLTYEKLEYFGLEYKFIANYLKGNLTFNDLKIKLNTAIQQYAKRQMTYFRKMEKDGIIINWLNADKTVEENSEYCINKIKNFF